MLGYLLFGSVTGGVIASIVAILKYYKRKKETKKMIEEFERKHPPK